ncbi:unnamed protein product [Moneuplotes crassus]|uniref:Uncharacterized protein n=1 Tax=Euplotes crassus TaxID=5936 RepID=A0AAD1UM92_EUPCR|nr:unnamed protein product [Moneuplotes crassus]
MERSPQRRSFEETKKRYSSLKKQRPLGIITRVAGLQCDTRLHCTDQRKMIKKNTLQTKVPNSRGDHHYHKPEVKSNQEMFRITKQKTKRKPSSNKSFCKSFNKPAITKNMMYSRRLKGIFNSYLKNPKNIGHSTSYGLQGNSAQRDCKSLLLINLSILSKLIGTLVQLHMEGEDRRPKTKQNQSILNFIQINESIRLSKAQQSINREAKLLKQINQLKSKNKDLHEKLATEKEKYESVKNILKLVCQTLLPNNPPEDCDQSIHTESDCEVEEHKNDTQNLFHKESYQGDQGRTKTKGDYRVREDVIKIILDEFSQYFCNSKILMIKINEKHPELKLSANQLKLSKEAIRKRTGKFMKKKKENLNEEDKIDIDPLEGQQDGINIPNNQGQNRPIELPSSDFSEQLSRGNTGSQNSNLGVPVPQNEQMRRLEQQYTVKDNDTGQAIEFKSLIQRVLTVVSNVNSNRSENLSSQNKENSEQSYKRKIRENPNINKKETIKSDERQKADRHLRR